MEYRLNIFLGVLLVGILLATGRNLLLKKAGKKQPKQVVTSKIVEKKPERSTPAPVKEAPPETTKLSLADMEKVSPDELCSSDWEKNFCKLMSEKVPSFRGATLKENQLTLFIDSTNYFLKTRDLLASVTEEVATERKKTIAAAIFVGDLLANVKDEINQRQLNLIFKKDPMFTENPETFAVICSGGSLSQQDSEFFSDEKLRSPEFELSSLCRFN